MSLPRSVRDWPTEARQDLAARAARALVDEPTARAVRVAEILAVAEEQVRAVWRVRGEA